MAGADKVKAEQNKKMAEETNKVVTNSINESNKKLEEKILNLQKFIEKEVLAINQKVALGGGGDSKGMAAAA